MHVEAFSTEVHTSCGVTFFISYIIYMKYILQDIPMEDF
jgi:hypothetical protein